MGNSWKKADFERAKAVGSKNYSQYAILEESWWEQRNWGVTIAIDTLVNAKHPLASALQTAVADLQPVVPSRDAGFKVAKAGQVFSCGKAGSSLSIGFDATGPPTGRRRRTRTRRRTLIHRPLVGPVASEQACRGMPVTMTAHQRVNSGSLFVCWGVWQGRLGT